MPALAVRSLLAAVACLLLAPVAAHAQPPFAAPAPLPPAPAEPPAPPAPPLAPPAPPAAAMTDHEMVVGHWGIEARQIGDDKIFNRTPGNDLRCSPNCPILLNALEVRKWRTSRYAWNAGLALASGGGSRYSTEQGSTQSWDVFLGIGPTVGANFLLHDWRHVAVSFSPQLDAVYFVPRSSGPKTFLLDVRGLIEAEVHMGFIGLPELSVGTTTGLVASYLNVSHPEQTDTLTHSKWNIGLSGPQTLWGLVTNLYLRFYF
jgi:hypothetical protein